MDFRNYNDFEIIEFVQQGSEEALQLMVDKYKLFIAKKISKFNLYYQYDDSYQEALIVLYRSIMRFKPIYNKTFTRYFEMNLENCFISIIRKNTRYYKFINEKLPILYRDQICETPYDYVSETDFNQFVERLSSFEKIVFEHKFFKNLEINDIANNLNCGTKKVYNAIERIRTKLKMHLE